MIYNCSFPFASHIDFKFYSLIVLSVVLLFVFLFYKSSIWRRSLIVTLLGSICFIGGGIYNFSNRLSQGCVADPLSFFGLFSFNFADLFVITGLLLLGSLYIMHKP